MHFWCTADSSTCSHNCASYLCFLNAQKSKKKEKKRRFCSCTSEALLQKQADVMRGFCAWAKSRVEAVFSIVDCSRLYSFFSQISLTLSVVSRCALVRTRPKKKEAAAFKLRWSLVPRLVINADHLIWLFNTAFFSSSFTQRTLVSWLQNIVLLFFSVHLGRFCSLFFSIDSHLVVRRRGYC